MPGPGQCDGRHDRTVSLGQIPHASSAGVGGDAGGRIVNQNPDIVRLDALLRGLEDARTTLRSGVRCDCSDVTEFMKRNQKSYRGLLLTRSGCSVSGLWTERRRPVSLGEAIHSMSDPRSTYCSGVGFACGPMRTEEFDP